MTKITHYCDECQNEIFAGKGIKVIPKFPKPSLGAMWPLFIDDVNEFCGASCAISNLSKRLDERDDSK